MENGTKTLSMLNPDLPPKDQTSSSLFNKFEKVTYNDPEEIQLQTQDKKKKSKISKFFKEDLVSSYSDREIKLKNREKTSTKKSEDEVKNTGKLFSNLVSPPNGKKNQIVPVENGNDYSHLPDINQHGSKIFSSLTGNNNSSKFYKKKQLKIESRLSKNSPDYENSGNIENSEKMENGDYLKSGDGEEEIYESEDESATFSAYQKFVKWKEERKEKHKKKFKKRNSGEKSRSKNTRKNSRKSSKKKSEIKFEQIPNSQVLQRRTLPIGPKLEEPISNDKDIATRQIGALFGNLQKSDMALREIAHKFNAFAQPDKLFISRSDYLTKVLVHQDMDEDSIKAINFTKRIIKDYKNKFTNLAFEGGGVKAFAYSGVVYFLDKYNLKKDIRNVIGTSAGGIAAMLFALDLEATTLIEELMKLDFKKFADKSMMGFKSAVDLFQKFGLYEGKKIIKFVEGILEKYGFHKDLTFRQLYDRTGINLVITGTEITTMKGVYFHKDNPEFPDMEIKHAIRITTSLPIAYKYHEYTPKTGKDAKPRKFVDGVLFSNLPLDFWDEKDDNGVVYLKNKKTLGVLVSSKEEMEDRVCYNNTNLLKYVANIVGSLTGKISSAAFKDEKKDGKWERIIEINTGDISVLNFDLTNDELAFMFKMGYEATALFFGLKISADMIFVDDFRDLDVDKLLLNEEEKKRMKRMKHIQDRKVTCYDRYLYWLHYGINKVANIV